MALAGVARVDCYTTLLAISGFRPGHRCCSQSDA